uniref:Uncharacterized protein n=1 Tax=Moniliophthora roreri TaxID=221103 RepID=A0A0W0FNS5_MONRR
MRFSQELVDAFIDYSSNDTAALMNLSLISRSWAPRSRKHLFRRLELIPHQMGLQRPRRSGTVETIEHHIQRFIELCSHSESTIPNAGITYLNLTPSVISRSKDQGQRQNEAFVRLLKWLLTRPLDSAERGEITGKTCLTYAQKLFWNVQHLRLGGIRAAESMAELK